MRRGIQNGAMHLLTLPHSLRTLLSKRNWIDSRDKPITALQGKLKWQKNIQSISRLLRERPHPGLRNEPPLDSLDPQSLNPFMASLWIGSGEGLAIKGFGDWGSRLSSGGSFWSPGWGRSHSSLEIDWIFFCHFNFPESAVNFYHTKLSTIDVL